MTELERYTKLIDIGWTYDHITGNLYNSRGEVCLNKNKDGYIQIFCLKDKKHYCVMGHRFAYYYHYRVLPVVIDHINGTRTDNKITNLRSVDYTTNNRNQKNAKGFYKRKDGFYQAQITVDKQVIYLGIYKTEVDATEAYHQAKKLYHK